MKLYKTMKSSYLVLIISLVLQAPLFGQQENSYTLVGNVMNYERNGQSVLFKCDNAQVKLSFIKSNTVRVQMTTRETFPKDDLHLDENGPYAIVNYNWEGCDYTVTKKFDSSFEGNAIVIETDELLVKIKKKPFKLNFFDKNNKLLVKEKEGLGFRDSIVFETMELPDDEHFFGLGAYKNPLDLRGTKTTCYSTELGEENEGGGFPIPWFISSKGYGIYFNNLDDDVTIDLGTKENEYSFSGTDGHMEGWSMDYYFIYGPSVSRLLEGYISLTGNPILPEKSYFGHIQSRCCDWSQEDIVAGVEEFRDLDIPLDVIVIDFQGFEADFVAKPDDFPSLNITQDKPITWDKALFNNPSKMFKELEALNAETCISTALFRGIYDWTKYDPTDPEVTQHYWSKLAPFVDEGIEILWLDNAERYSQYSGHKYFKNGYKSHQLFGTLWAKNMVEGFESMGKYGRPAITRSGAVGAHRYALPWPGDLAHGLEYFSTDLDFLRNGGLSGFTNITVDLGGFYDGEAPLEKNNVIRRMFNLIPIVPVSRSHGAQDGGLMPSLMDKESQYLYRGALKFRYRLHPYIYSAAIEGHLTGRPILASLVVDYQKDTNVYSKDYQFMFGKQFLAAPVMDKDVENWDVYLPKGNWTHYWTGTKYSGNQMINIGAPMMDKSGLPLFVKEGAIIPMMEEMNYIYEKPNDDITLDIYPSSSSSYMLYDKASAGPNDPIIKTEIYCTTRGNITKIRIVNPQANYKLSIHSDKKPKHVVCNSNKIKKMKSHNKFEMVSEGWYFGAGLFYGSETLETLNVKTGNIDGEINITILN